MSIQAIDHSSIHRLTSGQVIIDLQTAVKELIENGLDSGATSVEVRFKEHGVDAIEVQDNGRGIEQADWNSIALKHHTSKLTSFTDLTSVTTLGFRGEALSSLCGTASLSMVTSTASTAPIGTTLSFTQAGECVVGSKVARSRGTTVVVKELFNTLPVRRKELIKNAKREFGKAVELVQSYALIKTDCRIEIKNNVKGKTTTHLQTSAASTLRSNFSSVFGPKSLLSMDDLHLEVEVNSDKTVAKWSEEGAPLTTQVIVKGLISKPTTGNGRSTGSRQFFYINGRPFNPMKISKAFNEVYKDFNTGSFPCVVADFQLPTDSYDVNVSPDKRTIFLNSEDNLIAALKSALEAFFQPSRSTFPMSQIGPPLEISLFASSSKRKASLDDDVNPVPSTPTASSSSPGKFSTGGDDDGDASERGKEHEPRSKRRRDDPLGKRRANSAIPEELEDASGGSLSGSLSQNSNPNAADEVVDVEQDEDDVQVEERSPTPFIVPPPFRQLTLDSSTSSLSLDKSTFLSTSRRNSSKTMAPVVVAPKSNFKGAVANLRKFLHPASQKNNLAEMEIDELDAREEGSEDEEELEEEGVVEEEEEEEEEDAESGQPDSDDKEGQGEQDIEDVDILVVENSFKPPSETYADQTAEASSEDDDEITMVEPPARSQPREPEILGDEISTDVAVSFEFGSLETIWSIPCTPVTTSSTPEAAAASTLALNEASIDADTRSAEETLSRVVSKEDFEQMLVVGQFNLGFVIARRTVGAREGKAVAAEGNGGESNSGEQDDLFIIDQHASDEKYNFEKLQTEAIIDSQRLLHPRTLELAYKDEVTAMENLDVLRMNGFEVTVDEEAPVGQRVKLVAQPVSKKTVFGVEDLDELLELIASRSAGDALGVRPSKVRRMLASRACRKSVMIGTALTLSQMTGVVRHMAHMDQPWLSNAPRAVFAGVPLGPGVVLLHTASVDLPSQVLVAATPDNTPSPSSTEVVADPTVTDTIVYISVPSLPRPTHFIAAGTSNSPILTGTSTSSTGVIFVTGLKSSTGAAYSGWLGALASDVGSGGMIWEGGASYGVVKDRSLAVSFSLPASGCSKLGNAFAMRAATSNVVGGAGQFLALSQGQNPKSALNQGAYARLQAAVSASPKTGGPNAGGRETPIWALNCSTLKLSSTWTTAQGTSFPMSVMQVKEGEIVATGNVQKFNTLWLAKETHENRVPLTLSFVPSSATFAKN